MKTAKYLAIGLIAISIWNTGMSQNWNLGPVVGLNMCPVAENDSSQAAMRSGLSLGFQAGPVWEGKPWGLRFGLVFNQRYTSYAHTDPSQGLSLLDGLLGGILQGIDLKGTETTLTQTTYWTADVPISLQYKTKSGLFFEAGVYGGLLIAARNRTDVTTHIPLFELFKLKDLGVGGLVTSLLPENGTVSSTNQSTSGLSGLNAGAIGGMGADIHPFVLSVRYQYGFNNLRTDGMPVGVKNQQLLSIHLAYLFSADIYRNGLRPKYNLELIK